MTPGGAGYHEAGLMLSSVPGTDCSDQGGYLPQKLGATAEEASHIVAPLRVLVPAVGAEAVLSLVGDLGTPASEGIAVVMTVLWTW